MICFCNLQGWPFFSHRLNTILQSDRIVVMDAGKASFYMLFYIDLLFMQLLYN
jgi:hypothetical protein